MAKAGWSDEWSYDITITSFPVGEKNQVFVLCELFLYVLLI